ncbi:fibronectin type III domain-containing protein [Nocardiopsis tropica]|uniref:Fibronectin type III domain-containing protein n=1 Tax=Nocardiopsis tropica TaxID=109330 RepID=A0ABU7L034_9ACTN|nr:fibronectin type III domain-containing protein [Nocardiopsis umidischolae]MEE2054921.1 fibronectin type III domain-containing protein [Nocardiopsis umidischolae]
MVDPSSDPAPPAPRPAPLRRWARAVGERTRSHASGITVTLLAAAVVSSVLGTGAVGRADEMSDGTVWLWTSPVGEAVRVNGNNAAVDLVASLPEAAGVDVQVVQNDEYLLLYDPATGKVTSVDLRRMGYSGVLELGSGGDFGLVLGEETAAVIDRATGEVKAVDPATLQPTGATLNVPAPLTGGAFDDSDTLWLGVPTQGTAVGVRIQGEDAAVTETLAVAEPGTEIAMTVLDDGALVTDPGGGRLVAVRGDDDPVVTDAPVELEGAEMPVRTHGDVVAVTLPGTGEVLTVTDPAGSAGIGHFPAGDGGGTATAYEGRVYVPFPDEGTVRVFDSQGAELNPVSLPGAEGPLELEVREGRLYINSPHTGVAAIVDPDGGATVVDKADPPPGPGDADGGAPAPQPLPGGNAGEQPETGGTAPDPGAGTPASEEPSAPEPEPAPAGAGDPDPAPDGEPDAGEAPGAPTPVSVTAGDGSAFLSWPEAYSPDAPVDEYRITWEGGRVTVGGDELEAEVTGLANGSAYRFMVRAVNSHGTGPAAQTSEIVPGPQAPDAPADVTATASGSGTATVSWSAVEGANDYLVATRAASGENPSDRTSGQTSVDVAGLSPGETYTFTVTARTEGMVSGESTDSAPLTMPEVRLGAPSGVSHTVSGDNVTVTWAQVDGAAEYTITPRGDGGLGAVTVTGSSAGGGQLSHTLGRGGTGRCYSFTVVAVGADGTAADSSTSSQSRCEQEFR